MNKITRILSVFLIFLSSVFAQPKNGTIKGTVIDKYSNAPIESADISLHRSRDSSLVKNTITDSSGNFVLSEIPPGRYFLKAILVGYSSTFVSGITVTPENPIVNLEPIKLSSGEAKTEEIVVEDEKSPVELKPDRKVFNISKEIVSQGGT
ncbi:MAG: carboxypeptidase-like regulatory domain-containing protein, partial [Ignavibacteria bacterium]